jgi:hypothetical protein
MDLYDHPIIRALCAEAGVTPEAVADADQIIPDMYSNPCLLQAVGEADYATPEEFAVCVLQYAEAGDLAVTLALRQMFGLLPLV